MTAETTPIELRSTLSCPCCGQTRVATMPRDYGQLFYQCRHRDKLMGPLPGDCCVYCSYGSVYCPPVEAGSNGCS